MRAIQVSVNGGPEVLVQVKAAGVNFIDVAARAGRFDLLSSVPLMLEYESVLTRPEHLAASEASREDVSAVLDELASVGNRVELIIRTRPMLPDPNDEMVLETAINGRADAIVTFNDRDFRPVAARFLCSVLRPGVVILRGHPKPAIQGHLRSGHTEGMECRRNLGCGRADSWTALEIAPRFPLAHNINNNITL
jgi:predicted nucleic acid-binding protein